MHDTHAALTERAMSPLKPSADTAPKPARVLRKTFSPSSDSLTGMVFLLFVRPRRMSFAPAYQQGGLAHDLNDWAVEPSSNRSARGSQSVLFVE